MTVILHGKYLKLIKVTDDVYKVFMRRFLLYKEKKKLESEDVQRPSILVLKLHKKRFL